MLSKSDFSANKQQSSSSIEKVGLWSAELTFLDLGQLL